jgi:hypothetical protein
MLVLRKLFRTLMEGKDKDVNNAEIAQVLGVCDATISNFFNYKNELTLTSWLMAIRYLAPEQEEDLVDLIADEMITTENRLNCRLLMEYASTKRNFKMLSKIIDSQKTAPKENKDWAEIYDISLKYQSRQHDNEEIFMELVAYKPKNFETKVFSQILKARIFYMLKEYKSMFRVAKIIEKDVERIKNPYIRESYTARLCELFAHGYLYLRNDVKKARFYANNVINSKLLCPKFTSHMYHLLGTSFVFESYEDSIRYFQQYYNVLKEQGRDDMAEETKNLDIFFTKVLWGQDVKVCETSDTLEQLHYYARKGLAEDFRKAIKEEHQDDPFALCYNGIINNDPESLLKSISKFIENGNKFFAELPRKEIAKFPAFTFSANLICAMNIA